MVCAYTSKPDTQDATAVVALRGKYRSPGPIDTMNRWFVTYGTEIRLYRTCAVRGNIDPVPSSFFAVHKGLRQRRQDHHRQKV